MRVRPPPRAPTKKQPARLFFSWWLAKRVAEAEFLRSKKGEKARGAFARNLLLKPCFQRCNFGVAGRDRRQVKRTEVYFEHWILAHLKDTPALGGMFGTFRVGVSFEN